MICKTCSYPSFREKPCPPGKLDLALAVGMVALTILGVLTQTGVIQVPYLNCAAFTGAALGLAALSGKWIYQCVRGAKSQPTQVASPTIPTQSSTVSSTANVVSRDAIYAVDESQGNAWRAFQSGEKVGFKAVHVVREETFLINNVQMTLFGIFPKTLLSNFTACLKKIKAFKQFERKEIHKLMAEIGNEANLVLHTGSQLIIVSPEFISTRFQEPLSGKTLFSIEETAVNSYLLFSTPDFWQTVSPQEYALTFTKESPSQVVQKLTELAKEKDLNEIDFLVIKGKF